MDKILEVLTKLLPLLAYYPEWVQMIFTVALGGLLVTAFFLILLYPSAIRAKAGFVDDAALPALIKTGRNANRDYVIESVTMVVELDASGSVPGRTSVVNVNISYEVFALNNVTVFDEGYHSMEANTLSVERIHGSDPDSDFLEGSPDRKTWNVSLPMMPGMRRSVSTERVTPTTFRFPRHAMFMISQGLGHLKMCSRTQTTRM